MNSTGCSNVGVTQSSISNLREFGAFEGFEKERKINLCVFCFVCITHCITSLYYCRHTKLTPCFSAVNQQMEKSIPHHISHQLPSFSKKFMFCSYAFKSCRSTVKPWKREFDLVLPHHPPKRPKESKRSCHRRRLQPSPYPPRHTAHHIAPLTFPS